MKTMHTKLSKLVVIVVLVNVILAPWSVTPVHAYGESKGKAHQWLLAKSISYLQEQRPDLAERIPWEQYTPVIEYGIWYADNVYTTHPKDSRHCDWTFHDDECDAIHHYGHADKIESEMGVDIGNPGELPAPVYAQELYDQAVIFWPGSAKPSLASLPRLWAGNIDNALNFAEDMGYTYPGGIPFCERTFSAAECPRWPYFASPGQPLRNSPPEDVMIALQYLGWSIHLVQDLTVPFHARNDASLGHKSYESETDDYIKSDHYQSALPAPTTQVRYTHPDSQKKLPGYPDRKVAQDYFDADWSVEQYAMEARRIAEEVYCWDGQCYPMMVVSEEDILQKEREHLLDTAIKLVAAILEDYFEYVTVPADVWEPNNSAHYPAELLPGLHSNLTIHDVSDSDFFVLEVPQSGRRQLAIDVKFRSASSIDENQVKLTGPTGGSSKGLNNNRSEWSYHEQYAEPGKYVLEITSPQADFYSVDFQYSDVKIAGELLSDQKSIVAQDMIWHAVSWYAGDFTALYHGMKHDGGTPCENAG